MYSDDIDDFLSVLNVKHHGVYASDRLPRAVSTPAAIVVNTDPHTRGGTHWLAIFIDEKGELDFFDSYGRPPVKLFTSFIRRNSKVARFTTYSIQDISSDVCGQYCLVFLYFRTNGVKLNDFLDLFTNNPLENDRRIKKLFSEFYSAQFINKAGSQSCCCRRRSINDSPL